MRVQGCPDHEEPPTGNLGNAISDKTTASPQRPMESSRSNPSPRLSWESQLEESQMPVETSRAIQDEIISVYEVFMKDDAPGQEGGTGKPGVSVISSRPAGSTQHQVIQSDCALDLDTIDIISADGDVEEEDDDAEGAVNDLLEKEPSELEALQSRENQASQENMLVYSQTAERPSSTAARLIDKDDPRSRLHYVKYLKRDGKTLKIWECGICSKEFRHQYTLMRHLPTHTDERNFKCDACGKAFRQLSTLSQHKAIHSDARPYVCEFCKKTFNRVSTLISHRKTHSEHKPHKCHLCGKGFHQKGNLRNHVFTHTNERPYKCELCGKGFNQMSNLVCHKVKAHAHAEKMQYSCGICGKEFPRRFSLRAHEEYKHGIKYRQNTGSQAASSTADAKTTKKGARATTQVPEDEQQSSFADTRDKDMNMTEFMENIIIDKIETQAMEAALLQGQTPFALFKPAKGIPVLVKVTPSGSLNHLLTPATADDLKMSGKMDSGSAQLSDIDGSKSVQIKVPVVATVTEKIEADGKISFIIEPPGPDQEQVYILQNLWEKAASGRTEIYIYIYPFPTDSLLTPVDPVSEVLPCEENCPRAEPLQCQQSPAISSSANHAATDDELLELAEIGGIQFVRATEDGRYEVMTNSEARDLMAQNSHDVKILGAEETEAINNVISIHSDDFEYMPALQTAPTLEAQRFQRSADIELPDSGDIMVLDPNNDQKALTLGDIEILEDKELRQLLDAKCLEDRYGSEGSGVAYLSQLKIDEIINVKPISAESEVDIVDENGNPGTSQNELSSILNHRSELSAITASSLYSRNSQSSLHPLPALHEPIPSIPFLKNNHSFSDELGAFFSEDSSAVIDYSTIPEYNSRLKLSELEDDPEAIFMTLSQNGAKVVAQKAPNVPIYDTEMESQHDDKIVERMLDNPVKLTEDKNLPTDLTSHLEDYRYFNTYDQFFKNTMYDSHYQPLSSITTPLSSFIPDIDGMKKDMQILEKTLESKFFTTEDFENKENDRQFKLLDQIPADGSFGQNGGAITSVLSSVENFYDKEQDKVKMDTSNFLQACSPCGPADFLYFENRLSDRELTASPSRSLEKSQHERVFATGGLPDLDY